MQKWFKRITGAAGIVLLVLVAVWGISKLVGPSRAERAALKTMSEPVSFAGRNAYPAIWLQDYPVPAGEMDAVMAEDVRRFVAIGLPKEGTPPVDFTTSAAERYRSDRPAYEVRQRLCSAREDCLAKVRTDLPGYDKLLDEHAGWIARMEAATHADQLSNPFPPRMDMPLPTFASTYAPATLFAARFARGDREAAIASTCAAINDWRKLGAHSNMLISWAIARGFGAEGYGGLLAQMLAEVPNDQALPPACVDAMAVPNPVEISMCTVMRGEFDFYAKSMASVIGVSSRGQGWEKHLFYDDGMTQARTAVSMAKYCSPATDAAFAADQSPPLMQPASRYRLQCVANFIGSPILGALSDQYGRRPVLLIGFCGLALSFFVTAAAHALWVLVVVRLFSGAMPSNISVANAIYQWDHQTFVAGLSGAVMSSVFNYAVTRAFTWK